MDSLHDIQKSWVQYLTQADATPPGEARPERLAHYRRLVGNIFHDTLEAGFPIAHHHLPREEWDQLVAGFMANHNTAPHRIWELCAAFVAYCAETAQQEKIHRPYLIDLLTFEWMELDLHTRADKAMPELHPFTDDTMIRDTVQYVNPYMEVLPLDYPVHKERQEEALHKMQPSHLIGYRDLQQHQVHFIEVSILHAQLLSDQAGKFIHWPSQMQALQNQLPDLPHDVDTWMDILKPFILHLQRKGILSGWQSL